MQQAVHCIQGEKNVLLCKVKAQLQAEVVDQESLIPRRGGMLLDGADYVHNLPLVRMYNEIRCNSDFIGLHVAFLAQKFDVRTQLFFLMSRMISTVAFGLNPVVVLCEKHLQLFQRSF